MPKKTIQDIKIKRTPRTPVRSVEEYREEEYRRPERSEVKSQPVRSAKGSRSTLYFYVLYCFLWHNYIK